MSVQLCHELLVYEDRLPKWLNDHEGEYVVIKGDDAAHFSPDLESALTWAYSEFGLDGFFVKQVEPQGGVVHLTRDVNLCL